MKNKNARPVKYAVANNSGNSSWSSRNMIISGLVVLAFLGLHMYDFWAHEVVYKYVEANAVDSTRYYGELVAKFESPVRTGLAGGSKTLLRRPTKKVSLPFKSSLYRIGRGLEHPRLSPASPLLIAARF